MDLQPVFLRRDTLLLFPNVLMHFLQALSSHCFGVLFFNLELKVGFLLEPFVQGSFSLLVVIPLLFVALEHFLRF